MPRNLSLKALNHLAANYVLGTLSPLVQRRLNRLRRVNPELEARILHWEQQLSPLNASIPAVEPMAGTWQRIHQKIQPISVKSAVPWWRLWLWPVATSSSLAIALITAVVVSRPEPEPKLSYVAVLENAQHQSQLVATLYGKNRLVLNLVNPPNVSTEQQLHLWVSSKTDHQRRSLGTIQAGQKLQQQQLTPQQWELIKDSHELLISLESRSTEIKQPSEQIVARGLCVQLLPWKDI